MLAGPAYYNVQRRNADWRLRTRYMGWAVRQDRGASICERSLSGQKPTCGGCAAPRLWLPFQRLRTAGPIALPSAINCSYDKSS